MSRILVTGATGFIGRALCVELLRQGHAVRAALRREQDRERAVIEGVEHAITGDITAATDWHAALKGVEAVVHLAARVHLMRDEASKPLTAYRAINTQGTLNLARQAASAGVRRFLFVSSIKVNGEGLDIPYTEDDPPMPADPYAVSKWEAEQGLMAIAAQTGLELVILRPPLVYGPGVGGNFLRLLRVIHRGIPLPLGSIHNQRDLLYLGNLINAMVLCLNHPSAQGKTFLIRDGEPLATPDLIRRLAREMQRKPNLFPIPPIVLCLLGKMTGKSGEITRLTGAMRIDDDKLRTQLGWEPPFTVDAGLRETVNWFLKQQTSD